MSNIYRKGVVDKAALLASIRGGDRVTALFPNGIGRNGREYKERTGTANPLLIFPGSHVVINLGGRYGTPGVVDVNNIVSVKPGKNRAEPNLMHKFI